MSVSKTVREGSSPSGYAKFLLGVSLVRSKALVFEISITGSNPVPSAKYSWVVKWYNKRLITANHKFDSCSRNHATLADVVIAGA